MDKDKFFIADSHCHLNILEEEGGNIDDAIKNAEQNNVKVMNNICTSMSEFPDVLKVANKYPNVFCSVGVHPQNVREEGVVNALDLAKIIAENPKIVGIGETGLDYSRGTEDKELQIESFKEHILAAQITRIPLIIHSRDVDEDMMQTMQIQLALGGNYSAVMHCYSSSLEMAKVITEFNGMYISFAGNLTFKNADNIRAIAREIPIGKIIVETDAPYLAPMPHRGKRNEPAFVRNTLEFLADLKGMSYEEAARITTENFFHVFKRARVDSDKKEDISSLYNI